MNYLANIVDLTSNPTINPAWPANNRPVSWIEKIVVHHEAQFAPDVYENTPRYVTEAQYQNNTSIPGSVGIQYHFHIDNVGTISRLRPLSTFLWHCGDYAVNQRSVAICVDGDFSSGHQTPTREQYESLKQLLDDLSTQHPEFPAVQADVFPHRKFFATNCCGDNLVGFVDGYRTSNGNIAIPDVAYQHPELQPGYVSPSQAPAPVAALPVPASTPKPTPTPVVDPTPVPVTVTKTPVMPITPETPVVLTPAVPTEKPVDSITPPVIPSPSPVVNNWLSRLLAVILRFFKW